MFVCRTRSIGLVVAAALLYASPLAAQDSSLAGELERLRRDMNTLQAYVFRGEKKAGLPPAGGGADFATQDSVSQLQLQVQELRQRMREMNGSFEEIQHRIGVVADRLDKLVAEVDLRLRSLEEGKGPVSPGARQSRNGNEQRPPPASSGPAPAGQSGAEADRSSLQGGQKPFGTLSQSDVNQYKSTGEVTPSAGGPPPRPRGAESNQTANRVAPAAPVAAPSAPSVAAVKPGSENSSAQLASLPGSTPKEKYDYAYDLLLKRDLPNAEVALRAFVDQHPKHELADNAIYWLGETYYARKNYQEAIRVYYDAYKTYPKGNKAPDVLLKLGMSLASIGEKDSACSAYDELTRAHPEASPRILGAAKRERQSLNCK